MVAEVNALAGEVEENRVSLQKVLPSNMCSINGG